LALTADRNVVWSDLSISNDRDEFETLQPHLVDLDTGVLVGLDVISIYWLALYALLIEQDVAVVVTFLADALSVQMSCLLGQPDLLEIQWADVDAGIAAFMAQIEPFITTILAGISDIERFPPPTKLVAYADVDPFVY
jgi:transposase